MSTSQQQRIEQDSMGEVKIPKAALWGPQTERARQNFQLSGERFPTIFIQHLARVKHAAASANLQLELLSQAQHDAICHAAETIIDGHYLEQFPLDIYQTGSGTSTNMNMNEVIAAIAAKQQLELHPNDHVNCSQSSNDTIPTTILVSVAEQLKSRLLPAIQRLQEALEEKAQAHEKTVKTGRTHLMDAMPMTLAQELRTWHQQLQHCREQLENQLALLTKLPQGGTAIGTGINAPETFSKLFCDALNQLTECQFQPAENKFAGIAGQEVNALVAGSFNALASTLLKICNDLRWMNSGPLTGLAEIQLQPLQPGSSIMPGKVNPVIPEAVAMICARVSGAAHSVSMAAQQGNFQLNVMLPLIAQQQLTSIELLSNGCEHIAHLAVDTFTVNEQHLAEALYLNPILVTALNRKIGYNAAAKIAKLAYQQQQPILEVALQETDLTRAELEALLDPMALTKAGIPK